MTDAPKKTARKTASTKAESAAKAPAKKTTAPRAKKGPKVIRNLHGMGVHLRLEHPTREKPYRIELKGRGLPGDCKTIPVELQGADGFASNVGVLFEIITETERRNHELTYPQVGYTQRQTPVLVREEDTRIAAFPDWDGKGRMPNPRQPERINGRQNPEAVAPNPRQGDAVGPTMADVPGSDRGLHAQFRAGETHAPEALPQQGALPPGMTFDRPTSIPMTRQRT